MPQSNTDEILNWSKWVTGLSLFSATGCIGVLIGKGVTGNNIMWTKFAISFFLLTIFIAWGIQFLLAVIKGGYGNKLIGIPVLVFIERLIKAEFVIFFLSLFCLGWWIWGIKANDKTISGVCTGF